MKLGFSRKDITPETPVPLAGFLANRISQGVHDKLYVRALYFDCTGGKPIVLLQLDLLNLDNVCLEKIYAKLKNGSGAVPPLDKNDLVIYTSHTHSGLGGIFDTEQIAEEFIPLFGETDPRLIDLVVNQCCEAVAEAAKNCVESAVRTSTGTVEGVGTNRRKADIPCDNSVFLMEFQRNDQKKILLYNYSCHPTVLNGENLLISADYPGSIAKKLEGTPSGYDMVVFINGSAGDVSTRFTRKENSFAESERYAAIIIKQIESAKKESFVPLEKAELSYHPFSLRRTKMPDPEHARENFQNAFDHVKDLKKQKANPATIRKAVSLLEGAMVNLLKSSSKRNAIKPETKTVEAGILRINTTTIVCSPFELFSSLALILKNKKQVECFGYVNELHGYLADCDAWDSLDYEALSSDFERGEGERYIELLCSLI